MASTNNTHTGTARAGTTAGRKRATTRPAARKPRPAATPPGSGFPPADIPADLRPSLFLMAWVSTIRDSIERLTDALEDEDSILAGLDLDKCERGDLQDALTDAMNLLGYVERPLPALTTAEVRGMFGADAIREMKGDADAGG